MPSTSTPRRVAAAASALALVLLLGACVCFDPTIRFDLSPATPAAIAAPTPADAAP
jgi:hypothetical protein